MTSNKDIEDPFVNIWFGEENKSPSVGHGSDFYAKWVEQSSAKHISPEIYGANLLRKLYPGHSLVMSSDWQINPLNFPGAYSTPIHDNQLVTDVVFMPLARRLSTAPGLLVDRVALGSFTVAWQKYEFIIHIAKWTVGFSTVVQNFILHDGPEEPARNFLLTCGVWQNELHNEIWVFNQGFWNKDRGLWNEIQKADWKDVILHEDFKKTLQKDVYGFFSSEKVYKDLALPWKRGLIMHGPPGNGKTISIKVIMKTCDALGFKPLYVKSFQSWQGEEGAMQAVFSKARDMSPCVVIIEDLDSLINDRNRSFFLNQLDGLESNDGLLVIGTTNHFDRLDPGLSTRPSRFDRKFLFDDPDHHGRLLYVQYWQKKLKDNKDISFPDDLAKEIANSTEQFSFAYLKEVFVSSLVLLATWEGKEKDKPEFASTIKTQIKALREQLDKSPETSFRSAPDSTPSAKPTKPGRDFQKMFDGLATRVNQKLFTTLAEEGTQHPHGASFGDFSQQGASLNGRVYRTESSASLNVPGSMPEDPEASSSESLREAMGRCNPSGKGASIEERENMMRAFLG